MSSVILSQEGTKEAIKVALQADTPLFIYGSTGI